LPSLKGVTLICSKRGRRVGELREGRRTVGVLMKRRKEKKKKEETERKLLFRGETTDSCCPAM